MSNNPHGSRYPAKPINKKSVFERQRAEAEAKRKREEAETAAIYDDFVKSFDDGSGSGTSHNTAVSPSYGGARPAPIAHPHLGGASVGGAGGRRHFSIPSSGPSSLRSSGPGSLGPAPSSYGGSGGSGFKKRPFTSDTGPRGGGGAGGNKDDSGRLPTGGIANRLAFGDDSDDEDDGGIQAGGRMSRSGGGGAGGPASGVAGGPGSGSGNAAADRAEEKAISKPTIRLANLPPATSPVAVKALVAPTGLTVDNVRMLPASSSGPNDRKAAAAIVTLASATAASDIDAAVSALQSRYLGYGYYLNLHRHLSSVVVASASASSLVSNTSLSGTAAGASQPFGAKHVPASRPDGLPVPGGGFAPPPPIAFHGRGGFGRGRGVPPPSTFGPPGGASGGINRDTIMYVPVRPPRDIKKLRMIHKVIENVLDHGPEFEALLMSRPEVQREEKWAWIWDARSEAGVWYRYRLWEIVTGHQSKRGQGKYMPLFEGSNAWKVPDNPLPYEFNTDVAEFVSDSEYNSSDDSDYEDGNRPADAAAAGGTGAGNDGEDMFLNPIEKAKLTHLLARLPTTLSKLRKGDIARVTAFAITHASRGSSEIVEMIVSNVEHPLAFSAANPEYKKQESTIDGVQQASTSAVSTGAQGGASGSGQSGQPASEIRDTSGAKLIAVYVVSDILSSSATSGIRHAWRYRQLFENALRNHKVFEGLGLMAEKLNWGRLRADKWKRSIGLVLSHWDGWSVFSAVTHEYLVSSFENPPSAKKEEKAEAEAAAAKKKRWKTVDTAAAQSSEGASSGFRPVDTTKEAAQSGGGDAMDVDDNDTKPNTGAGGDREAYDDEYDEYRSEYTDDEELDMACLDQEDIDGEAMVDTDAGALIDYATRLDGIPLTAEEIEALGGGEIVEASEEGEIGTDDDDYDMSGLSAMSSDVEMEDVKETAKEGTKEEAKEDRHDAPQAEVEIDKPEPAAKRDTSGTPSKETPKPEVKSVGGFQMSAAAVGGSSRKRIRAVDMFADSDDEGKT